MFWLHCNAIKSKGHFWNHCVGDGWMSQNEIWNRCKSNSCWYHALLSSPWIKLFSSVDDSSVFVQVGLREELSSSVSLLAHSEPHDRNVTWLKSHKLVAFWSKWMKQLFFFFFFFKREASSLSCTSVCVSEGEKEWISCQCECEEKYFREVIKYKLSSPF